jgi:uncharacterized protein YutE (UPF0331/DUF86 family)
MSTKEVIENKISDVRDYLEELKGYQKITQDDIRKICQTRGAVERYLQLAVQSSIDLAEAVVAYKKLRKPATLSDNFLVLNKDGLIDDKLAQQLIAMVGFRNIIVHQYREVDEEIVIDILQNHLIDIEKFIEIIQKEVVNE